MSQLYDTPRPARVHYESWAGHTTKPVLVRGETPKRYVVEGRSGRVWNVPKYAVTFDEPVAEGAR